MPPVKKPKHTRERHFLREWRDFRGLSQEDAADRAIISRSLLSRIEGGKSPYDQDKLERLAQVYGCSVADLIGRDPNAQPRIPIFDLPEDDRERVEAFVRALRITRTDDEGRPTEEAAPSTTALPRRRTRAPPAKAG